MLSKNQLSERMKCVENKLVVQPKWMLDNFEAPADDVSVLNENEKIDRILIKVTNDRLPIHLGCFIYAFEKRNELNKYRWSRNIAEDFIIDLRKMSDGYPLQPGETIVAASSEYFQFPNDLAGIVISRVGNHLTGINLGTTFIDSGWRGIITFQITNVDKHTRLLKLGQEIARLFVFALSSPVDSAADDARKGSHHADISWDDIFRGNRSPFEKAGCPQRLNTTSSDDSEGAISSPTANIKQSTLGKHIESITVWLEHNGFTIPNFLPKWLIPIVLFCIIYLKFETQISETYSRAKKIFDTFSSIDQLIANAPERKVQTLIVQKGQLSSSKTIDLDKSKTNINAKPIVIVETNGFQEDSDIKTLDYLIIENKQLEIKVKLKKPVLTNKDINIEYIIFWRTDEKQVITKT